MLSTLMSPVWLLCTPQEVQSTEMRLSMLEETISRGEERKEALESEMGGLQQTCDALAAEITALQASQADAARKGAEAESEAALKQQQELQVGLCSGKGGHCIK